MPEVQSPFNTFFEDLKVPHAHKNENYSRATSQVKDHNDKDRYSDA